MQGPVCTLLLSSQHPPTVGFEAVENRNLSTVTSMGIGQMPPVSPLAVSLWGTCDALLEIVGLVDSLTGLSVILSGSWSPGRLEEGEEEAAMLQGSFSTLTLLGVLQRPCRCCWGPSRALWSPLTEKQRWYWSYENDQFWNIEGGRKQGNGDLDRVSMPWRFR